MSNLSQKVAIVTGASRGIGRAIAVRLAQEGAQVFLTARNAELLDTVTAEIKNAGGMATFLALDLREPDAASLLVQKTLETFGTIDIVVNNAGATKRGDFLQLSEEDWSDGFALKFFGAVRLIRAAWPHLKERQGSVLNIAGVGGRTPGAQFTIGGSVNAALLSLTKALADRGIEDGIQVNAVNPGSIRTDRLQTRLKSLAEQKGIDLSEAEAAMVHETRTMRIGETADIANLVAFIVSPQGRFLQGALIDSDGGQTKTI